VQVLAGGVIFFHCFSCDLLSFTDKKETESCSNTTTDVVSQPQQR